MGPRGALLLGEKSLVFRGIRARVRDTTGAGDIVTCTMTYMLGKGEDLRWSFAYANALAIARSMGDGPYGSIQQDVLNELVERIQGSLFWL
jgi:fructose-1-phosphate kinase PfkB-like protein